MTTTDLVIGIVGATLVVSIFAIALDKNMESRRLRRDAYQRNHAHKRRWYE